MVDLCKTQGSGQVCNAMEVMQRSKDTEANSRREVYERLRVLESHMSIFDDVKEVKETLKVLSLIEAERKGERKMALIVGRGVWVVLITLISWLVDNFFSTGGK